MGATHKIVRMEQAGAKQCLAVNEAVALFRDKWTILTLGALSHAESLRYNELQRAVFGISQRMLTLTLKTLVENGLVKRTVFPTVPPRVDYELTPMGRTLGKPLKGLLEWSDENRSAMAQARQAHATRSASARVAS
jgi:DNA-binding HxlR family transcriptional regulator